MSSWPVDKHVIEGVRRARGEDGRRKLRPAPPADTVAVCGDVSKVRASTARADVVQGLQAIASVLPPPYGQFVGRVSVDPQVLDAFAVLVDRVLNPLYEMGIRDVSDSEG